MIISAEDLKRPSIKVEPGCQPITVDEFYGLVKTELDKQKRRTEFRICYFEPFAKRVSNVRPPKYSEF